MEIPKQRICVDLDAIMDTRLATIATLSEDAAKYALHHGYHQRTYDAFDGINESQYRYLYKRRDTEILQRAYITSMVPLLKHLTTQINEQATVYKYHSGAALVINTYPYEFDDELKSMFAGNLLQWLNNETSVEFIHLSPKELKPNVYKEYVLVIKYDYEEWLNTHIEELANNRLCDVTFMFPAMFFVKNLTPEEIAIETKKMMHPFAAVEMTLRTVIGIDLIDVCYFSLLTPENIQYIDDDSRKRAREIIEASKKAKATASPH